SSQPQVQRNASAANDDDDDDDDHNDKHEENSDNDNEHHDIYIYAFNGVLYLHWACIQQVMYMGVDDRVFVPPSDVYVGNMPLRVSFTKPEDLNMCLNVCHFMTPEDLNMCLNMCRFMTPEDLNMCLNESYDNLWRLLTDEAQESLNEEDRTPKDAKDFVPSTCGLFKLAHGRPLSAVVRVSVCFLHETGCVLAMGVCPPIYKFYGGHTGGGTRPAEARTARASRRSEPAEMSAREAGLAGVPASQGP
ncbi:hypothetical protein Taro_015804, partial [Colocasia esculenta]|nr:hypothetical protein [Colocasia esculenta]